MTPTTRSLVYDKGNPHICIAISFFSPASGAGLEPGCKVGPVQTGRGGSSCSDINWLYLQRVMAGNIVFCCLWNTDVEVGNGYGLYHGCLAGTPLCTRVHESRTAHESREFH